jgi:hypothetical protein
MGNNPWPGERCPARNYFDHLCSNIVKVKCFPADFNFLLVFWLRGMALDTVGLFYPIRTTIYTGDINIIAFTVGALQSFETNIPLEESLSGDFLVCHHFYNEANVPTGCIRRHMAAIYVVDYVRKIRDSQTTEILFWFDPFGQFTSGNSYYWNDTFGKSRPAAQGL